MNTEPTNAERRYRTAERHYREDHAVSPIEAFDEWIWGDEEGEQ